jgi:hypothetical protein
MDRPLLIAFIDRWRLETHSFHLPCGEMSVLMQDVAYILGLHLDGPAVTGMINTDNWKEMVHQFTGHYPPNPKRRKEGEEDPGCELKMVEAMLQQVPTRRRGQCGREARSCLAMAHGGMLPSSGCF